MHNQPPTREKGLDVQDHRFQTDRAKRGYLDTLKKTRSCSCSKPHRGWVVVLSAYMANTIFAGFANFCGLYTVEWFEYFDGSSVSEISWIGSILLGTICIASPLGAYLSKRFGDRRVVMVGAALAALSLASSAFVSNVYLLMLTFGVITGFGFSMVYLMAVTAPMYYFDEKYAGLAVGIATSGNGCGSFLMPLILEQLIQVYGWRGSLLISSGLVLNICVCGAVLRKPNERHKSRADHLAKQNGASIFVTIFKNVSFDLFLLSQVVYSMGISTTFVHLAALIEQVTHATRTQSAAAISVMGILNFIGRITHGAMAGWESVNIHIQYGVCSLLSGIALILLPHVQSYIVSMFIVAAIGFCFAPYGSLIPLLIPKMVGMDNLKAGFGTFSVFSGIGWMTGAPIAGLLYDVTGNYGTSMYFGGAAMFICVLLFLKAWVDGTCWKSLSEPVIQIIEPEEEEESLKV